MKEWINKVVCPNSGISSKRVCGVLGWLVVIMAFIYCTIVNLEAPLMVEVFIIAIMSLLGIDSVTSIWKKPTNNLEVK